MRVELLSSSIPQSSSQFLVTFLVEDVLAIDAGSLGLLADLDRQTRVRHVLLTHEHIDHVATLPIFLENVYEPGPDSVELLAAPGLLELLHRDVFNGRLWPDFLALSKPDDPFLVTSDLASGRPVERAGLTITPIPVSHGIETFGVTVDDGRVAVAFPSDTGPTEAFWEHCRGLERLAAVFLETSFPARQAELASISGHLCTTNLAAEMAKLGRDMRWIIVHRKPRYAAEIAAEIAALGLRGVELVEPGRCYEF